ncbi:glycosyltransferase [Ferrovibrio sp.]|uniref:glycosyltransferase n=1 Tax=Ferrovibrio sp. TaxID=1917215 RepID=UPI0025BB11AD|nr:glycosyltransferase [Ferrovibrio sp.]
MRILAVLRLASGLRTSMETGDWRPTGSPALVALIERLSASSHRLRLVFTDKDGAFSGRTVRLAKIRKAAAILAGAGCLPSSLGRLRFYLGELLQACAVWRMQRQCRPDILYFDRSNVLLAALFARFGRIPVVLRVLGVTPDMKTVHVGGGLYLAVLEWAYRSPFALVICTQDGSGGGQWLERALRPEIERHVLLNGIGTGQVTERQAGAVIPLPAGKTLVLFVGRLENIKGCDEFLDAIAMLHKTHADRLHAVIVGTGSREQELRSRANVVAPGMVTFTGAVSHKDMSALYSAAHVYVSLNRQGNLSNANLEAMKYGLCVIAPEPDPVEGIDVETAAMLPPDSIVWLFRTNEKESLAHALIRLCDAPEERLRRGRALSDAIASLATSWPQRIDHELLLIEEARRPVDVVAVISDMGPGGAQRVLSQLTGAWQRAGRKVALVTLEESERDFYPLPEGVRRIALTAHASEAKLRGLARNAVRILALRQVLRRFRPTSVVGFIGTTNVLVVAASAFLPIRTIVSERNDPTRQSFGWLWDLLCQLAYRHADVVTANSMVAVRAFRKFLPASRLLYVPNPLSITANGQTALAREKIVLAVGRLHPQKGHDVLLRAFARVAPQLDSWKLVVIGEGDLADELRMLAEQLDIADRVEFLGRVRDVFQWYRRAGLFVMASRYEGTPNALLEALGHGCACIVSDSAGDAQEYIRDGENGLTFPVDDSAELAKALCDLARSEKIRVRLGSEGIKSVSHLTLDNVASVWDKVLG